MWASRRAARWAGAVLLTLAPLPWLAVGAAAAQSETGVQFAALGNNPTLKVHEEGTPSGTESSNPKVCAFNFEGFEFDVGQTGYLMIDPQGGNGASRSYGPFPWGPADATGFAASDYFNAGEATDVADGQYQATLYAKMLPGGKLTDSLAKSNFFKVICDVQPTPSWTSSHTRSSSSAPASSTPASSTPASSTPASSTPATVKPTRSTSSAPGVTVLPTRSTAPAVLPQTGSNFPTGGALVLSLLLIGLGALLIVGPQRVIPLDTRRH